MITVKMNGRLINVEVKPFNDEQELRKSLLLNLDIIPVEEISDGEDRTIRAWRTEFPLRDFGSIDILGVGDGGGIYLIETKLFQNKDKRKIIAQVLDYSTGLWKYYGYNLDGFLETLKENGQGDLPEDEDFYRNLRQNLSDANYKVLIVMDEVTVQARSLIEFLNKHTDLKFLALEIKRYVGSDLEIITIPYIYGEEITREPPSPPLWPPEKLRSEIEKISDPKLKERLMKIMELALQKKIFSISRGNTPQFSIKYVEGKVLHFDIQGNVYAFFGINEIRKFPSNEERCNFVKELKALNLLPRDLDPDKVKSGRNLIKRLNFLTNDEFSKFITLIERLTINNLVE